MKNSDFVYFCRTCGTDIRFKNVRYHEDLKHQVEVYKHDPRSTGPIGIKDVDDHSGRPQKVEEQVARIKKRLNLP